MALFLFLVLTIGFCSGYFIATSSLSERLAQNYSDHKTEDGHFTLTRDIDGTLTKVFSDNDTEVYELFYKEKTLDNGNIIRVYKPRENVNIAEAYSGTLPKNNNEIAIDRLYAGHNDISIGDNIKIEGKELKICGFFVAPDYTSLYKNNTDLMFDSLNFSIAIVTDECFDSLSDNGLEHNYAWVYNDRTLSENEKHDKAEKLMTELADKITKNYEAYKNKIMLAVMTGQISAEDIETVSEKNAPANLTNFIPSESNSAINMATEDVGSDKIFMMWLLYITIAVIALAAAITTKSTVEQEAAVIGTLRASGYRKGELVGHYLIIPVIVMLLAALVGNVIGYTFMNSFCAGMYYKSYSFPVYTPKLDAEAFIMTTIVPVGLVMLINFAVLSRMMSLPPLQFLRRELKRKKKTRTVKLSFGSFTSRFRTRIILKNMQAYIVLFIGVFFANILLMFSLIWTPLINNYKYVILDNQISEYQYILKAPTETKTKGAEKFAVYELKNSNGEDITIYGISENSEYLKNADFSNGKIYFSSSYSEKYGINAGDTKKFTEKFSDNEYQFKAAGIYNYPPSLCVFMNLDDFRETFNIEENEFSGYFSNDKINDIDEKYIAKVITKSDLTSTADQMEASMGFVQLFSFFAVAIYILMIYILAKMITERNSKSISVLKIIGYKNSEISNLYNFSTGIVVLIAIFVSLPIITWLIELLFHVMMMEYNGWISFSMSPEIYPQIIVTGCLCFLAAYLLEMRRVRKIAMNEAIKDME